MIGGEGIVVEIDGSKFGWRKYNRGHRVDGVWMFDKTHERRIVLLRFKKRDKLTLSTFVTKGSVIHTDKSKSYSGLIFLGYNIIQLTIVKILRIQKSVHTRILLVKVGVL